MLRAVLSAVILAATALPVATDVNCDRALINFLQRLGDDVDMAGERLANLHRSALRIFDACDAGHLANPEPKFHQLVKS